ncbi:MAG: TetR/AcrR family transcriptional regulator [Bacteroidales bacterium]
MKDTKEFILETAYDMFLRNNYEAVTMSRISEATQLTKGAIYHHYASKGELFKSVVDKYILENKQILPYKHINLYDFVQSSINEMHQKVDRVNNLNIDFTKTIPMHYISLMIDSLQYYPNFARVGRRFHQYGFNQWKNIIEEAMKNGEIRKNIDTEAISMNFLVIHLGIVMNIIMKGSINSAFEMFKKQMEEQYKLLKI